MDKRKHQQKKPASPKDASKQGISTKGKKQNAHGELSDKDLDKVSGGTDQSWKRI